MLSLQHLQRSPLPAAGWQASSSPLNALQQHHSLPSALHHSQYLSLHCGKQTEYLVSQTFRSGCCHELWLAFSLAERLPFSSSSSLMFPGLFWWHGSSCTAPDRIQIPKTVGMSYSPLSCKLFSVLHWSRCVWLLEYSAQSCSWFGSLYLSETKRTFTSESWIQGSIKHHKISEEINARSYYFRIKLIKFKENNYFIQNWYTDSDILSFSVKLKYVTGITRSFWLFPVKMETLRNTAHAVFQLGEKALRERLISRHKY